MDFNNEENGAVADGFPFDLNILPSQSQEISETESDSIEQEIEEEEELIHASETNGNHRKFLSNEDRKAISYLLLSNSQRGRLRRGATRKVAAMYLVSNSVIRRIWGKTTGGDGVCHRKTKKCGRKKVELDPQQFLQVPLARRTTLRDLSFALNINKTSLVRLKKEGAIERHSNPIKPFLKEENMVARLHFCLTMIENGSIIGDLTFKSMHNIVHIDEKWFYMTKKNANYYLLPGEEEPLRTTKNKNFIGKVMFLVAVARPRFDSDGNETFSGKIGVFPLVTHEPAKRKSVNRPAGTLVTKPIVSVTKDVSRRFLIEHVVPAIKEKWPRNSIGEPIYIQQDNARCHVHPNDSEFCRVATEGGFDIRLMNQPPNSPDLNILDLGFFNAIQSLQYKEVPKTTDDLIAAVVKSFESFSSIKSNKIFLTLQCCMVEILKKRGSNKYDLPHIRKEVMEKRGSLPNQIKCDPNLVEEVREYLRNQET
ncbi:hypothetical protein QN277_001230 [Acacia crassicarpa]|uniref:DUF7769 domain-containing protein n=1 Tax=Acacia crassicarpa TaxID=499986 RepID=A0AAE1TGK4_9FABA|nr:hypothetical protein QN277_001229 [Acacia crassicarpa]KAK4284388.1 hypothetical protein QN277_001230 [Acacia crassicarpa]